MDDRTIARAQARMIRMCLEQAGLSIKDLWRTVPASVAHVDEFDVDAFLHHAIHLAPKERDLLVFAANFMLGSKTPTAGNCASTKADAAWPGSMLVSCPKSR